MNRGLQDTPPRNVACLVIHAVTSSVVAKPIESGLIMRRILTRRLATSVPTVFLCTVLVFAFRYLLPGGPVQAMLGGVSGGGEVTPAQLAALKQRLGLNGTLVQQYWHWLVSALHGDLGTSYFTQVSGHHRDWSTHRAFPGVDPRRARRIAHRRGALGISPQSSVSTPSGASSCRGPDWACRFPTSGWRRSPPVYSV